MCQVLRSAGDHRGRACCADSADGQRRVVLEDVRHPEEREGAGALHSRAGARAGSNEVSILCGSRAIRPGADCTASHRVFVDDSPAARQSIYEQLGIDPSEGVAVLVRPDGHVSIIIGFGSPHLRELVSYLSNL